MPKSKITIVNPYKNITAGLLDATDAIFQHWALRNNHCLTAQVDGKTVAAFFFSLKENDVLWAKGTAVDKEYRRRGIARKLWKTALRTYKPKIVSVSVISLDGKDFIENLKQDYPNIDWDIW